MTEFKECEHANRGYCWREFSNGSRHFGTQCLKCGDWHTLSKKEKQRLIPHAFDAPDYDPEIKASWFRDQSEIRKKLYQEDLETKRNCLTEYYNSQEWLDFRSRRLEFNRKFLNGLCEVCFTNPAQQCHHMTYSRLYSEWIFDVAALCPDCHKSMHDHMDSINEAYESDDDDNQVRTPPWLIGL